MSRSATKRMHPGPDEGDRRHGEREPLDLLPQNERCDTFRVDFDYYTPRVHFVILPHDKSTVGTNHNALNRVERLKVVKAAVAFVSHYKLKKSAILSVHFGSWITKKDMYHAHVCADVEDYLSIFERKREEIPEWPSRKYVTRQWKASQDPRAYALNVRGYPFRTYFKEEIEAIEKYRRNPPSRSTVGAPVAILPPFNILHHPSEPKVGFAVENSARPSDAESFLAAQETMIEFATQNKLTDMRARDDNDGCHVCLALDGRAHGFNLEDSQFLVGYIQVTGPKFYRDICPNEKREEWFAQFTSKEDYKVYT